MSKLSQSELICCLELVNKVYRRDKLSPEELMAVNNLIENNPPTRKSEIVTEVSESISLENAIICSVNDPLWRECLGIATSFST